MYSAYCHTCNGIERLTYLFRSRGLLLDSVLALLTIVAKNKIHVSALVGKL